MGRVGVLLLFLGLVGCASVPTPTPLAPAPAEEVKELAGAWQGWLVTERSFALFTTWFIMGLWHGANWTFAIWGLWHASLVYIHRVSEPLPLVGSGCAQR